MSLDVKQVQQFAAYVDQIRNGGNQNGYVDGVEVSVFKKKIKTVDRNVDVDSILKDYDKNKVTREADFDNNKVKSDSNVENAIISAFNPNSNLRVNDKQVASGSTIASLIKNSDEDTKWWDVTTWFNDNGDAKLWSPSTWFNNEDEMLKITSLVNKENVLEVVQDEDAVKKIAKADDEVRTQVGSTVIKSLVELANDKNIDVSNVIKVENGKYLTGRDVDGVDIFSDALDAQNFIAVVNALKTQIEKEIATADGEGNPDEVLYTLAKRIDTDTTNGGNANGYIDTKDEVKNFKQAAAQHGYDIGKALQEIRDNDKEGVENTSNLQITVANIFDPTKRALSNKVEENEAKDVAKAIADGIGNGDDEGWDDLNSLGQSIANFFLGLVSADKIDIVDGNKELLDNAIKQVNSNNVMTVLNENPGLIEKILNKYNHGYVRVYSNKDREYTTPILEALIQCAQQKGIVIDDLVIANGEEYVVGSGVSGVRAGEDALHWDNVAAVIKAIQVRINQQTA